MEERRLKIIWTKAGTGSPTTKLAIPISWCYNMGLDKENREIIAIYDYNKKEITIKKEYKKNENNNIK